MSILRRPLRLPTALSVPECLGRLARTLDAERSAFFSLSGYAGSKPVIERLEGPRFRLQMRSRFRGPLGAMLFDGQVAPDADGALIEGQVRYDPFQQILTAVWLVLVGMVGGGALLAVLEGPSAPASEVPANPWMGLMMPLICSLYAAYYLWRWRRERAAITAFLVQVLEARAAT